MIKVIIVFLLFLGTTKADDVFIQGGYKLVKIASGMQSPKIVWLSDMRGIVVEQPSFDFKFIKVLKNYSYLSKSTFNLKSFDSEIAKVLDTFLDKTKTGYNLYVSYVAHNSQGFSVAVLKLKIDVKSREIGEKTLVYKSGIMGKSVANANIFINGQGLLIAISFEKQDEKEKSNSNIIRINKDTGQPLEDNPFYNDGKETMKYIYSYGHHMPNSFLKINSSIMFFDNYFGKSSFFKLVSGGDFGYFSIANGKMPEKSVFTWNDDMQVSSAFYYTLALFPKLSDSLLVWSNKHKELIQLKFDKEFKNILEQKVILHHPIDKEISFSITMTEGGNIYMLESGNSANMYRIEEYNDEG